MNQEKNDKKVYFVIYDFKEPKGDYSAFFEEIRSHYASKQVMKYVIVIQSDEDVNKIYTRLEKFIDDNVNLIIIPVTLIRGKIPNPAWQWLEEKLPDMDWRAEGEGGKLNPKNSAAWNNKGGELLSIKEHKEALNAFEKAIELNPKNYVAWHNKGSALLDLKRYEDGLSAYEKAIELNPNSDFSLANKGTALNKLNRYNEALKVSEKALALNPTIGVGWNNRGYALIKLNRYEEAIKSLEHAIVLDPNIPNPYYHLARVYSLKNEKENALKNLEKAIQLDSTFKERVNEDKDDFKNLWNDDGFKQLTA